MTSRDVMGCFDITSGAIDHFLVFFKKMDFLNIPFKKKASHVKIGQDALFLVLFNKKCQNMQKKVHFDAFFEKSIFLQISKILKFFGLMAT